MITDDGVNFRIRAIMTGDVEYGREAVPGRKFVDITVRIYEEFEWHRVMDDQGLVSKLKRACQMNNNW